MKRTQKLERLETKETRTLLITNITNEAGIPLIKEKLETFGPIKEFYSIAEQRTVLFAIYYDLRHSKQAKNNLNNKQIGDSIIKLYYTINKYEIPRDGDICDETKNQGTVLMVCRDLQVPITEEEIIDIFKVYGDVKEVREYKIFQKFVEFYDSRCAIKCFENFGERKYKNGVLLTRLLWDTNKKTRWDIIKETDNIFHALNNSSNNSDGVKKVKVEKKMDTNLNKNIYLNAMDEFIIENIDFLVEYANQKAEDL